MLSTDLFGPTPVLLATIKRSNSSRLGATVAFISDLIRGPKRTYSHRTRSGLGIQAGISAKEGKLE